MGSERDDEPPRPRRSPFERLLFQAQHKYHQDELDNLGAFLRLHLTLDRVLSIAVRLVYEDHARTSGEPVRKVPWRISARIKILERDGWLPADIASEMRRFNKVRNRLLHWTPGTPLDEIGRVAEIIDNDLFHKTMSTMRTALREWLPGPAGPDR